MRARRVLPLALAGALVLVGCGSDDSAGPTPLPSLTTTSPTPTPSATPTATASPSAPQTEEEAVKAAVRFYYEGYGRAYDSGDADELAKGSTPDCDCRRAVELLRDVLDGGTVVGGRAQVLRVEPAQVIDNTAVIVVETDIPNGVLVAESGTERTLPGPGRSTVRVILRRPNVAGDWLVFQISDIP